MILNLIFGYGFINNIKYFIIQDYFDIVKKPMDLSTIRRKLDSGLYTEPWEFVDDVNQMFDNAWLYNRKTSRVYKYASKVNIDICMCRNKKKFLTFNC